MGSFPPVRHVRQTFEQPAVEDIAGEVDGQIRSSRFPERLGKARRVAIAVGSRGITNLQQIVRAVVDTLTQMGCQPFIVAGMGTHGGGTAEGQRQILAEYGVTEQALGVPVCTDMQTVCIGTNELGAAVYWDKTAYEADAVIAVNRVKAHTDFTGPFESGILKMLVIGLGNRECPEQVHSLGGRGMERMVPASGKVVLDKTPFALGLAILENAGHRTAMIQAIEPEDLWEQEPKLLLQAKGWMARLPFDQAEVLLVGEMGKNYSGTGLDTNVIGRRMIECQPDFECPKIVRLAVLDLSPESHGNAVGIGLADLTTQRLVDQIDYESFRLNVITSRFLERARIPIALASDRQLLETCLHTCWEPDLEKVRLAIIPNTLELTELYVTDALAAELDAGDGSLQVGPQREIPFTDDGQIDQVTLFPHSLRARRMAQADSGPT